MQHRLARDTAAVKFVRHLRDLLVGRLQLDLRMKPPHRDHRGEPSQALRGRTMRKLMEQDEAVEASAAVRMKVAASKVASDADDTPSSTHIPPGAIILSAAASDAPPIDSMIRS